MNRIWAGKPLGTWTLRRPRSKREDNIKTDIKAGWEMKGNGFAICSVENFGSAARHYTIIIP
jgi:hypothetical protein